MKAILAIVALLVAVCCKSQYKVIFIIDNIPSTAGSVFAAGTFNGWNPGDSNYVFDQQQLVLNLPKGKIEFKLTKGSWATTECATDGSAIKNRTLIIEKDTVIYMDVKEWQDNFASKNQLSTASANVHIIDSAFFMPQLNRYRRIWVYLPVDYNSQQQKKYPVLYMHDGQNLFDARTSYAGEWGVDDFLDANKLPACIVVGIDNGGDKRMTEYNPYDSQQFGKGEGKQYLEFIVKTLKPYIDKQYRTEKNASHTIIAGSSMGGLISMYAILMYPEVFGKAGVFSPAFWVAGDHIYNDVKSGDSKLNGKIYFYAGGWEGEHMAAGTEKMAELLQKKSQLQVKLKIKKTGKHTEKEWQNQFPAFYRWILK